MKKCILLPENFSFPLGTEGLEVYSQTLKNNSNKILEVVEESFGTYTLKLPKRQTIKVPKNWVKIL